MKVTVYDVAREAGLSQPTVSLILNGRGSRYSSETQSRVLETARRLNYRPDRRARTVATGRIDNIALVLSTNAYRSTTPATMLDGVHDSLQNRNIHLTVAKLADNRLIQEGEIPSLVREWSAAGLLINYTHDYPVAMLDLVREYKIPAVWMNSRLPVDAVYPDDERAVTEMVQDLLALGHRRIGFVHYLNTGHYSSSARVTAYRAAMAGASLEPSVISLPPKEQLKRDEYGGAWLNFTLEWMSDPARRPTALIVTEEQELQSVVGAALRVGVHIPRDLSLYALRSSDYANNTAADIWVSARILPWDVVGSKAVSMLLQKIANKTTAPEPVMSVSVPAVMAARGATLAPPSAEGD